jgi:glycerate dehydrogenase
MRHMMLRRRLTRTANCSPGAPSDFNGTVQHTWALILALVNNIPRDHALVPSGSWTHHLPLNTYIGGATLGLLGLGKLGSGVARIASLAFGMRIIAWSENLTQPRADDAAVAAGLPPGTFKYVSKTELFEQSDIVSVHLILSDRTRGIVGKDELGKMKSTGFIVNTSRGPIIDENALLDTLNRGEIRGAALDVFDVEPLPLDSKWRTTPWGQQGRAEVVFTPHTGYSFEKHLEGMWNGTAENLQRIIRGEEVIRRMA